MPEVELPEVVSPPIEEEESRHFSLNNEEQVSVAQGSFDAVVATVATLILQKVLPDLDVGSVASIVGALVIIVKMARKFLLKRGHLLH